MKKTLFIVIITILVSTGISCLYQKSLPKNTVAEKATGRIINSVTFSCAGNKTIQVLFFEDKAELTLSDGRHMLLLRLSLPLALVMQTQTNHLYFGIKAILRL